jgi:hypothetical protein
MPVETSPQPLLVEEVGNQTDRATKHEQTVEDTHLQVVLSLLSGESTTVADEVNEADSNASVDVENEVVLLGRCDALDSQGVVEQLCAGEVLLNVLLDELDTEIGVVAGLDPVADTGDCGVVRNCRCEMRIGVTYSACSPSSWCQQSHGG